MLTFFRMAVLFSVECCIVSAYSYRRLNSMHQVSYIRLGMIRKRGARFRVYAYACDSG